MRAMINNSVAHRYKLENRTEIYVTPNNTRATGDIPAGGPDYEVKPEKNATEIDTKLHTTWGS